MTQIETPPVDTAAEGKARLDAIGLPVDKVERTAELGRLISAGDAEMRADITGWQRDPQRRADHKILLEEQERVAESGADGLGFYATATIDEVQAVRLKVEPAIAELESLMKADIRGYHAKENGPARALYGRLLAIRQAIHTRSK